MKDQMAFISYYDEQAGQIRFCVVPRKFIQSSIDRVMSIAVPPDAPEHSAEPFTDEDARKLGGMAILTLAGPNPELRARLRITTDEPMQWPNRPPAK
jgi:hypothetical protein